MDNQKQILAFKLTKGETEAKMTTILNDIYKCSLEGKNLKLIASEGSKGIRSVINMVYPDAKWQLCYTHKLGNLSKNVRHKVKNRRKITPQASRIFKANSKSQAVRRFNKFCQGWQNIKPQAVRCFKKTSLLP